MAIDAYRAISLPVEDDWHGWVDILTRRDTGTFDCVPECLRQFAPETCGPNAVPATPYGVAKFMLMGWQFPWSGTALRPSDIRPLLEQGIPGWAILEAAKSLDDCPPPEAKSEPVIKTVRHDGEEFYSDLYMIRSADGPIKIGVSIDPAQRLRQLQTAYPYKLELVCTIPGGADLEGVYHERFAEHRLTGEWFAPHQEILDEIERLKS